MKKFIYPIIAMLGILMPTSAVAQTTAGDESYNEAYVVLQMESENSATLTLYYDDKKSTHTEGTAVGLNEMMESPEIMQARQSIQSVTIDATFANCRPTSTQMWFSNFFVLKRITGMENLNTSEVTNMDGMFMECVEIEELDLSHFNTSKVTSMSNMFFMNRALTKLDLSTFDTSSVTDMTSMFGNCVSLTTILVGDKWTTTSVKEGDNYMFGECEKLVGGAGTTYSEDHTGLEYARIDAEGTPGYLTQGTSRKASVPTFSMENDRLVIATETADAAIYYKSADWTSYSEVDSLDRVLTASIGKDDVLYTGPIELTKNFILKAYTAKEGMDNSDTNTLVYDYDSWKQLLDVIDYGTNVYKQGKDNEFVEQKYVDELKWALDEGSMMYSRRIEMDRNEALYFIDQIATLCKQIEEQIASANVAEFDGSILTVQGQLTMAEALEKVGGQDKVVSTIAAIVWNSKETLTDSNLEPFTNPNMLIFVKDAARVSDKAKNVVVNGVAKSIVLSNTESGNNNFFSPQEFTAESISYTREFKQKTQKDVSRGWEGIALPFDVQTFTHETHGAIAPFGNDASSYHFWLHQMTDKGMEKATSIEAGKPYIISMPNSTSYIDEFNQAGKVTFSAQNAKIPVTLRKSAQLADGSVTMISTFNEIEPAATYALNVGTEVEGYVEGSVFVKELRSIRPFEVYTFHEGQRNSGSRFITVSSLFGGGNGTTGIVDLNKEDEADTIVKVYSLTGSLLIEGKRGDVIENLPRGIYIIGGKKIIKK